MISDSGMEHTVRVRVFVDFWNFQLSVNNLEQGFRIDWLKLGRIMAQESLNVVEPTADIEYQGMNVYGSYDPASANDIGLRQWALNTLDKFTGVQVSMLQRQRKRSGPNCPSCHQVISHCPECGSDMRGTEEKGVDTRIVTDMIRLAWIDNYDLAVLLSSDRDFVPVVEFLDSRGIKTVHGAFPPVASELTRACWSNISIPNIMENFRRS